jgi:HEPN domain-containing protein
MPLERSIARMLLDSAAQDLAACELLAQSPHISDAMVGFHAQQAVEKAIKSVLSRHGVEVRRTHDLVTLLDALVDNNLGSPPGADTLDELNPYAVDARYGTLEPSGLDRETVVKHIRAVLAWAESSTTS